MKIATFCSDNPLSKPQSFPVPPDYRRDQQRQRKRHQRRTCLHQPINTNRAPVTAGGERHSLGRQGRDTASTDQERRQILPDRHGQPHRQRGQDRAQKHRQAHAPQHTVGACAQGCGDHTHARIPSAKRIGQRQENIGQHENQMRQHHRPPPDISPNMQHQRLQPGQERRLRYQQRQI